MTTKWKVSIYGLLGGILVGSIAIFAGLCIFKLGLLIFISDPEWHQAVTIQHLGISFVFAVIGGVGLYFMMKYISPKIAADCKNYNMKQEKVHLRNYIGSIIAGVISGLGCFYLSMWIIPIQENNSLRFMIVYFLSFYFIFRTVDGIILSLLKKVRRSEHLLDA